MWLAEQEAVSLSVRFIRFGVVRLRGDASDWMMLFGGAGGRARGGGNVLDLLGAWPDAYFSSSAEVAARNSSSTSDRSIINSVATTNGGHAC